MLFNSFNFVYFFAGVLVAFFSCPIRHRWAVLLCASYWFYWSWNPAYLGLLLISTLCDYAIALGMIRGHYSRKALLWATLVVNLGILSIFKYGAFLNQSLDSLLGNLGLQSPIGPFELVVPVGISFYTFQTLSYSIDVYRGNHTPSRHLGRFALFVAFFPQLVAGPIERASSLIPQLNALTARFDYQRIRLGFQLILWGLFKKLVIADNLAESVEQTYSVLGVAPGISVLVATVAFAVQIYCDFSGYCDIAVGVAQCLGVDLSANFKSPYLARSIREFWSRWHITLSRWFRDYVYIPLGGKRCSARRMRWNLLATFMLSGLWHGANWTFVYWGAYHGVLLILERSFPNRPEPVNKLVRWCWKSLRIVITFSLVCIGWLFFRAENVHDALAALASIVTTDLSFLQPYHWELLLWSFASLLLTQAVQDLRVPLRRLPKIGRWVVYYILVCAVLRYGNASETPFVYFQF